MVLAIVLFISMPTSLLRRFPSLWTREKPMPLTAAFWSFYLSVYLGLSRRFWRAFSTDIYWCLLGLILFAKLRKLVCLLRGKSLPVNLVRLIFSLGCWEMCCWGTAYKRSALAPPVLMFHLPIWDSLPSPSAAALARAYRFFSLIGCNSVLNSASAPALDCFLLIVERRSVDWLFATSVYLFLVIISSAFEA